MIGLREASEADYPAIIALTNRAYRGPPGQASWKVEALVVGQRIDESLLRDDLAQPGAVLLVAEDAGGARVGHVRLDSDPAGAWYLSMLTIDPDRQDGGMGRAVLEAAEDYARGRGARAMQMSVVQLREELIAWYGRRGYAPTGETQPFPYDDTRFGTPTRDDLCFVILEKAL